MNMLLFNFEVHSCSRDEDDMGASKKLGLFYSTLILMLSTTNSEFVGYSCSDSGGNYTNNSTYNKNLDTLLSTIASNTQIDYGFYNFSAGQHPDTVNAIALCNGYLPVESCRNCVNDSVGLIAKVCSGRKEAIGWSGECMVRYSNRSIFGAADWQKVVGIINGANATDVGGFSVALRSLLDKLIVEASSGDSRRKFAVGQIEAPNLDTIFGFLQCTPDLPPVECNNCLRQTFRELGTPIGRQGARILLASCSLRYETYLFYTLPPPSPPPILSPPPPGNNDNRTVIIVVVSILSAIILVLAIWIILILQKLKKKEPSQEIESIIAPEDSTNEISSVETIQFDFDTIRVATNNFSSENKLGQGGFGAVYRGKLSSGLHIAVKRLASNSQQGDIEFKNEVLLVVKLQHRNLVSLLGFCLKGSERLLIYEFVSNGSLDNFIFDFEKRVALDWNGRYRIINGIARGLLYLHEDSRLRIIHRDLKASNILLNEEMSPKIADFGMARLFEVDETRGSTSRVVGTYGYMAPEYVMHGQFSVKSDVFSFGILVLEILSGQKNTCFRNGENIEDLSSFAWRNWREGTTANILDSTLSIGSRTEMIRCIHIGLLCVQENIANRPTMASVVMMLSSSSLTLPVPYKPAFFMNSITDESNTMSNSYGSHSELSHLQPSDNDVSITELVPR